ncbi:MAG TPA: translation elongation factor 4 [bacterium]|mgnify:FL=1|nr:MAG: Elongation factor 4 [bacterium ADurb.Bin270]HPW45678.1 translation elongation factor 4 [bacterium]
MSQSHIRNFCIIAHIDHGKSTLADRILEHTGALSKREHMDQFLDKMDLERERGITIKAQSVQITYNAEDGKSYELNLIDTPGHVDFHYEVSRSLAACDGALLVIDATQGVQAQTLANALLAMHNDLAIVPVINKIDLPSADVESAKEQCEEILAIPADNAVAVSAKTGEGIKDLLEAIVKHLPPPTGNEKATLRALIFDSWFDSYMGAVALIRVVDGEIRVGQRILLMNVGKNFEVLRLGIYNPHLRDVEALKSGEVGILVAGIKEVKDTKVGDTITLSSNPASKPLSGFQDLKAMVFAGLYPADPGQYDELKEALEKLKLNDSAFSYEPESSTALGFGFRAGFLGSLHLEIVQERLEREYNLELVSTAPTVVYEVITTKGEKIMVDSPAKLPEPQNIEEIREPYAKASILAPSDSLGGIMKLCQERRAEQKNLEFFGRERIMVQYEMPFSEMMFDFFDNLKSVSRGYASLDYEIIGYRAARLVKLTVLINGDPVDALSVIVHRDDAQYKGRELVSKLRTLIPRQMYDIAIQAAIGGKIIARETVKAYRKDVTSKCYGGDVTRKRKLLERQKEGKKRMKKVGSVDIPQEAFLSVLKIK